jgi:acetyltransferase
MSSPGFARLFDPRGIAVVGASIDLSRPGGQTVDALARLGFRGGIYPVNPRYAAIAGHRCHPSVAAIDGPCDVAVIALPAARVPGLIVECGRRGIGFAVVLGGGFREGGPEGLALEREMLAAAREHGVRIVGPNCLGVVNVHQRVFAAFGSVTRPPNLAPGPVSAVIQSGGFGNSIVVQCAVAGIGFRHVVASGMESDIDAPQLVEAFVADPETRAILLYLESVADGRALIAACRSALAAGKPVVAFKGGNSRQGMRAAASHTARMTASHDVYRAAFRQCGVIEVADIDDAVDCTQSLLAGRSARGRAVAVMGGSGGSLVVFSDAADRYGLTLPAPAERARAVLRANLPPIASIANPIDYTAGFVTDANAGRFREVLSAVLADPGIDQVGLLLATGAGRTQDNTAAAAVEAAGESDKPLLVFSSMPYDAVPAAFDLFRQARIPVLASPNRVARAMSHLAAYAEARERRHAEFHSSAEIARIAPALPAGAATLDEHDSKRVLAAFGIAVTRDRLLAADSAEAHLPTDLRFPLAAKIVSSDIPHKSDIGGVRLNLGNREELRRAMTEILANVHRAAPGARLRGVLACEMVDDGLETIVGVVNDATFGPVVAFGLGGVLAETLNDVTYRIAPFDNDTARSMIGELRGAPLFEAVRGRAARDVVALAEALSRVSELAWALRDRLAELDINPLLVGSAGKGAIAADALIVVR